MKLLGLSMLAAGALAYDTVEATFVGVQKPGHIMTTFVGAEPAHLQTTFVGVQKPAHLQTTFVGVQQPAAPVLMKGERDLSNYSFKEYTTEFEGKFYHSSEMPMRENIFNKNLKYIQQHNANPKKTFFLNVNQFADMTNEEFRKQAHGSKPHTEAILRNSQKAPVYKSTDIPDSVDWRTVDGVVTPVKNQGGCGSCWAFAATETLESHLAIATGKPAPILAPQQIVSCAPNPDQCGGTGGCEGATAVVAMNYTSTAGISTEDSYPYQGSTGTCNTGKISPVATNTGYVVPTVNNYTANINALANEGPLAISISAGTSAFQFYGGGVFSDVQGCGWVQDHAVQLTGYGTDGGKMYWNVRNSWGAGWGEGGYIRMERFGEGQEPCGTDNSPEDGEACKGDHAPRTYCGTCGILGSTAYPTGMKPAF